MYKWQESFSEKNKLPKNFIEGMFNILNKGTMYTDLDGKFIGYISFLEGLMGGIHIISDHSLSADTSRFIIIKIIYLNKNVLYGRIDGDSFGVYEFTNGRWANIIQEAGR